MKIAFLVGHFPILSEAFILTQITGLLDRGHDVDIYALDGPPRQAQNSHPSVSQYHLLERTYYPPAVASQRYGERLKTCWHLMQGRDRPISWSWLQLVNGLKYGREALSLRLLLKASLFFKSQPYDIIHCQFGPYGLLGQLFRDLGLLQGKLITTFRGYDISSLIHEKGDRIYQPLFQQGDYFLTNCEFFKHRLLRLGCPPDRIRVHFSGIDCTRFSFTPRHHPTHGPIRLVTTGRLVEKKGIEYCIQAVANLLPHHPNLDYTIIGDGPLRKPLQRLIQELRVDQQVHLVGWKHQDDIVQILQQAHLFLAPSLTARDGNQDAPVNTLKEAMAMGLPVISTWHGGIPELVEDGVSGFLVPERDAGAIADRLQTLIHHPERWPEMGKAGRDRVQRDFDMQPLNDELVEIYTHLVEGTPIPAKPYCPSHQPLRV